MASVVQMYDSEFLKRGYRPDDLGDRFCRYMFYAFNSRPFLAFLEALTGIEGLIRDTYFEGGGFHEIGRGGYLNEIGRANVCTPVINAHLVCSLRLEHKKSRYP